MVRTILLNTISQTSGRRSWTPAWPHAWPHALHAPTLFSTSLATHLVNISKVILTLTDISMIQLPRSTELLESRNWLCSRFPLTACPMAMFLAVALSSLFTLFFCYCCTLAVSLLHSPFLCISPRLSYPLVSELLLGASGCYGRVYSCLRHHIIHNGLFI